MTSYYKCGHERRLIVIDSNPLSLALYLVWKEDKGFKGDKSQCFDCWCNSK